MTFDPHGYYYPDLDGTTAPDIPADMQQLVSTLTDHTILWATDNADRDAKYGSDKPGIVVVTTKAPWYVWLKAGTTATWMTLFKDTGWVTTGFSIPSGWSGGTWMKARNHCGKIEVRCELVRTGADITALANGNVTDQTILTVPAQFTPTSDLVPGRMRAMNTSGNVDLRPNGDMILSDMNPTSTITNGDFARTHHIFLEG